MFVDGSISKKEYQQIDQWTRIEIPEITPHIYGQKSFTKGVKTTQWGKDSPSTDTAGKTGHLHAKERNWTLTLHHI